MPVVIIAVRKEKYTGGSLPESIPYILIVSYKSYKLSMRDRNKHHLNDNGTSSPPQLLITRIIQPFRQENEMYEEMCHVILPLISNAIVAVLFKHIQHENN